MDKTKFIVVISGIVGFLIGSILAGTYSYVTSLIPWIIGLIGGFIILVLLSFGKTKTTLKLQETPEMKKKALIYDDSHNLQHLFIITKRSSICIFDQSYIKIRFDPQLVGGFLTAISEFGSELMGSRKLEELTYHKFKILIGDGSYVQAALILESTASNIMKEALNNFIRQFEETHWNYLSNFDGQIKEIPEMFQIIERNYFVSLTLPHKVAEGFKTTREFNTLEKSIINIAQALSQEKDNFMTKDIVVIANITEIGTRAQIISVIFDLCKEGIFYPLLYLAPEAVWKESMQKRQLLISKAERAFDDGKLALSTKYFEEAAEISSDLGDLDTFFDLKSRVEEIRSKEPLIKKQIEERKLKEKMLEMQNLRDSLIYQAKEAFKQNNLRDSGNQIKQALKISIELEDLITIQNISEFYNELQKDLTPLNKEKQEELLQDQETLLKLAETAINEKNKKSAIDLYLQIAKIAVELRSLDEIPQIFERISEIKLMKVAAVSTSKIPQLVKPLSEDEKFPLLEGKILRLCTGKKSLEEIYKEVEAPKLKVLEILNKYQKKGYLKFLTVFE